MSPFLVNLDDETVQLDGVWYTQATLAEKIKSMLEQGDFSVSRPGQALEQLNQALASLKSFQVRLPAEWVDKLAQKAEAEGQSISVLMREALKRYLEEPLAVSAPSTEPLELLKPRLTVEIPAVVEKAAAPRRMTPRSIPQAAMVADKKKTSEPEDDLERGWFGGET